MSWVCVSQLPCQNRDDSHKERIPDQGGRDWNLAWVSRPLVNCDLELEGFVPEEEEKGFFSLTRILDLRCPIGKLLATCGYLKVTKIK